MAVDLSLLWQRAVEHAPTDRAAAERAFWDNVRMWARRGDLLSYGLYVHGHEAPVLWRACFARHVRHMATLMEEHRQTLFVCPPEHFKTALMRWDMELWLGVETEAAFARPGHTIPSALYVMNTAAQTEKQIMEIEHTLEHNKRYRELFPHVRPDKRRGWTKDHFFLDRPRSRPDPSLQGCGMFGPIQGSRAGKGTVDDPTDQQDARSETLLKAQVEWLAGTYSDRVLKGGVRRYILTRWSEKDSFSSLSKNKSLRVEVMPAFGTWPEDPEAPLWPEEWSAERLTEKKQELIDLGLAYLWQLAYMANPTAAEGAMFLRKWFQYGEIAEERKEDESVAADRPGR